MNSSETRSWQPSISPAHLELRSQLLARMRAFFAQHGVLEVETPQLSAGASTDPSVQSFQTELKFAGSNAATPLYLHTSPEFPMKRLLASGSGAIYQICKVFRNGESGRLHNPEFTMLEWYRPGVTYHELMCEVEALVKVALGDQVILSDAAYLTYRELFIQYAGVDPFVATTEELCRRAKERGCSVVGMDVEDRRDTWLDLILSHVIEPALPDGLLFVHDYPASQAALARIRKEEFDVAERFELYWNGVELANGFQELTDADEQRQRIANELHQRDQAGSAALPIDERFLAALVSGLPECSGVALGVDRLIMLAAGAKSIQEVLSFPIATA